MHAVNSIPPVVQLEGVSKQFGKASQATIGVKDVWLDAFPGELLLLLGPSGSGKTTLLTLMAGLQQSTFGTVTLFGRHIETYTVTELQQVRASRIGFVFQTFQLIDSLSVAENIELVLKFAGRKKVDARRRTFELLHQLQVGHLTAKSPPTLSQGEKQRVAIARAVANDPDLIIADEPTASLDLKQGLEIIHLLHQYAAQEGRCVVVASHDLRIAQCADRVLRMEDGAIREAVSGAYQLVNENSEL